MSNQLPGSVVKFYTYGDFKTENDAESYFESIVPSALFDIHKEVTGYFNNAPRHPLRIDYVLMPKKILIHSGWDLGIIGVECKKSGVDIGPVISQMFDYKNTTWVLTPAKFQVRLDFIFLFPMQPIHGQLASVMAQNRIGVCCQNVNKFKNEQFVLQSADGRKILTFNHDHVYKFQTSNQGLKTGSR